MDGSAAAPSPAHDEGESLELLSPVTPRWLPFDNDISPTSAGKLGRTRTDTDAIVLQKHRFLRAVAWLLWSRWVMYVLFLLVAFKVLFGLYGIVPVVLIDELTEGHSRYLRRTACGAGEYCKSTAGMQLVWVDYMLYILASILWVVPLPWLRRVCKPNGSLEELGLGKTKVSESAECQTGAWVYASCLLASWFFVRYFVLAGLVGPAIDPKG